MTRPEILHRALEKHVNTRLQIVLRKYEGKEDSQSKKEREKAQKEYTLSNILSEGIKYVDQVQIATHLAKGIHPDLKIKEVSNIYQSLDSNADEALIRHQSLKKTQLRDDATGNGAINKKGYELHLLLQVDINGLKFSDMISASDPDAINTVTDILNDGAAAEKLLSLYSDKCAQPSSHTLAKQIYWFVGNNPTDDEDYHLIAPLFPSSLVHAVHAEINDARFGEANKLARMAYRDKKPHDGSFHSYPGLAIRKLGGTKPQNISQLNSERGGVNYLLSSNPPEWKEREDRLIINSTSVFKHFRYFEDVNTLLRQLCDLLVSDPAKVMQTRKKRERIERALGQVLADYGSEIGNRKQAGWTREISTDDLSLYLQIWLDPDRAELPHQPEFATQDEIFRQAFEWQDWPDQVATDFALWLNAILRDKGLPVGDVEVKHWAKQALVLTRAPATFRRKAFISTEVSPHE